jgi:adenylyltransferase/sulfurtransferase
LTDRYARHIALAGFGEAGQRRVREASVLVVGAGGLGSPVALYLGAAGIGELHVSDFDRVDVTNLQRQILFSEQDVGRDKTDAAARRLAALNPEVRLRVTAGRLSGEALLEAVEAATVVADCCDNFATRFAVNQACVATGTPLVSGAVIRYEGQLAVFRADRAPGPCYQCLYQEGDEDLEDCRGNGVLGPAVGVIGAAMAVEALKLVSGCGPVADGRLMLYDALAQEWRSVRLPRDPACPVCSPPR